MTSPSNLPPGVTDSAEYIGHGGPYATGGEVCRPTDLQLAALEQARRAECFDDLLAALQAVTHDDEAGHLHTETLTLVFAAIKKAAQS